jgi:Tfp pilus assembly protein PilO
MTPNQFWYDEPRLLDVYIKKRELELDVINYNSWLIGLYVENAVAVVLSNALGDNSAKKITYFEKPLDEFNYNKTQEKQLKMTYQEQKNAWAKLGKKGG